jgi:hypothetical protein
MCRDGALEDLKPSRTESRRRRAYDFTNGEVLKDAKIAGEGLGEGITVRWVVMTSLMASCTNRGCGLHRL